MSTLTFGSKYRLLKVNNLPASILVCMNISAAAFILADSITRCFFEVRNTIALEDEESSEAEDKPNIKIPTAYQVEHPNVRKTAKNAIKHAFLDKISRLKFHKHQTEDVETLLEVQDRDQASIFREFGYIPFSDSDLK